MQRPLGMGRERHGVRMMLGPQPVAAAGQHAHVDLELCGCFWLLAVLWLRS